MAKSKEMEIAIKIAGKADNSFKNALSAATKGLGNIKNAVNAAVKTGAKLTKGLGNITNAVSAATTAAAAAVGAATTAAAAAVGELGVAAVKTGAEFEKSMSSLAATADIDIGSEKYKQLESAAREMGKATSKTAAESADALQYMALAGWSVEDSIKGLPSILHLSEATGMDLAQTSDMVTDTMSALGVSINQLPDYLNVTAKAQNTTNQSAEDLMQAYLGVGGTLKSLGISTRESATALGVLANRGTKGSEAGTSLNAILVNLTTGAGQAGKAMKSLGVSAFDSKGNFIGLKETLEKVDEATKEMTQEERNAILAAIGGKQHLDNLQKLLAGLNDTTADGTKEWEAIAEGLNNADGALENMRTRKLDNLNGDIDILKSGLSDLGISIYQDLNGPLRSMTQLATSMVEELSSAYQNGGMEGMVGAVGGCLSETVNVIADYAPEVVSMGVSLLENFIGGITENSGLLADAAADVLSVFINGLFMLVPQVIFAGIDIITELADSVTGQLPQLISSGTQAITNFVYGIVQRLPTIIITALTLVQTLADSISSNAPMLINAAIQLIGNLVLGIGSMLPQLLQMGILLILNLAQGILSNLPLILQMSVQIISNFISGFVSMLPMVIQGGIQLIISLYQGIVANLGNIVQAAVEIVITLAAGLIQAIPQLLTAVPQLIAALIEAIFTTDWIQVGIDIIKGIINGIMSTGKSLWEAIKSLFTSKGGEIDIPDTGAAVTQSYAAGIESNAYVVGNAMESLSTTAFSGMDYTMAATAGTEMGAAFNSGLAGNSLTAARAAADLGIGIADSLDGSWQTVDTNAHTAMQNLTTTVTTEAQTAANAVKSAFENMTITIPKPKIPNISVSTNSVAYGDGGNVSVPQFSVNWNASGGIFNKPTVFNTAHNGLQGVGEAGAEAVLPLDTLWTQMKNILTSALKQESGTGIVESLLQKLQGITSDRNISETPVFAGSDGPNITYAPVYNLHGNATIEDAVNAEKISQAEFGKMMKQWQKQNQRTKF